EAVADPRVRAVFLATPHSLHVEQIVTVAAAGKHAGSEEPLALTRAPVAPPDTPAWAEKPRALTRAPAERAIATCRKAGVVFGLGNNKRCFASMLELKRLVADGTLGEVMHIEAHFCNEHSTRVMGGWRDDASQS